MVAIQRMQYQAAMAHAAMRASKGVTPVQDWVLKQWQVPEGMEKSGDRVAHMLGITPRASLPAPCGIEGVTPLIPHTTIPWTFLPVNVAT